MKEGRFEILEGNPRSVSVKKSKLFVTAGHQLGSDFLGHPPGETCRAGHINGHRDHAAENATEEGGHPGGAVLTPDQDTLALPDPTRAQFRGETRRQIREALVGRRLFAQPLAADDGDLLSVPAKVLDQGGEVRPVHWRFEVGGHGSDS